MTWDDLIELGNKTTTTVDYEEVQTISYREVYANKKSVRQSEFYQAASVGLKPELMFEVHSFDYNNDETLVYNDTEYTIIRVYNKGELTELVCSALTGVDVNG